MSAVLGENVLEGLRFGARKRLPVILQTEAAECGLACLAMVARYYGHDLDLPSLRRKAALSLKGANLKRVIEASSSSSSTPARCGWNSRNCRS